MKYETINEESIAKLMEIFYEKVRRDENLSPILMLLLAGVRRSGKPIKQNQQFLERTVFRRRRLQRTTPKNTLIYRPFRKNFWHLAEAL